MTRPKILFFIFICSISRSFGSDDAWKDLSRMIFVNQDFFNKENIEFILQKNALSIKELYQILQDKKEQAHINIEKLKNQMSNPELLLNTIKDFLYVSMLTLPPQSVGGEGRELSRTFSRKIFNSLKYWIIGAPIFLLGISRYFKTESSSANAIDIGLIVTGGLLSAPLTIAFLVADISRIFPRTSHTIMLMSFETFVYKKINQTMDDLKKMYPDQL